MKMKKETKMSKPEITVRIRSENNFHGDPERGRQMLLKKVQNLISRDAELIEDDNDE
jgi:hypothetical protein